MVSFNVVYCYFRFSEVWMEFMEMIIFCYDVGVVVVGENIIVLYWIINIFLEGKIIVKFL